jgi:predicted amidohydrolase
LRSGVCAEQLEQQWLDYFGRFSCDWGDKIIGIGVLRNRDLHVLKHRLPRQDGEAEIGGVQTISNLCLLTPWLALEQVHIGGTFIEVDGEDFYNTFVLVEPKGNVLGTVRKAATPSFEAFLFRDGGYKSHVIDSELGAIGVAICYETMLTAILRLFVAK